MQKGKDSPEGSGLARGQATAQAVLENLRQFPELHDQSWFEMQRGCDTIHCVAGWAIDIHKKLDPTMKVEFGKELNLGFSGSIGAVLLDLDEDDADKLFYRTNNEQALHAMEYLAKGEKIDWEAVKPELLY